VIWRFYSALPPRSRLRMAIARRYTQRALEASNRRDYEVAFALYHPQVETLVPQQLTAVGIEPVTRGREARLRLERRWTDEWGEFRYEPEQLIDLGDSRFLVIGQMRGSGLSSGAAFVNDWALLLTLRSGRAVREQLFVDRGEALEVAGLKT
jgi:ketosteroid isomerase-like protein